MILWHFRWQQVAKASAAMLSATFSRQILVSAPNRCILSEPKQEGEPRQIVHWNIFKENYKTDCWKHRFIDPWEMSYQFPTYNIWTHVMNQVYKHSFWNCFQVNITEHFLWWCHETTNHYLCLNELDHHHIRCRCWFIFVWRKHELISPCTGSTVITSYEQIASCAGTQYLLQASKYC